MKATLVLLVGVLNASTASPQEEDELPEVGIIAYVSSEGVTTLTRGAEVSTLTRDDMFEPVRANDRIWCTRGASARVWTDEMRTVASGEVLVVSGPVAADPEDPVGKELTSLRRLARRKGGVSFWLSTPARTGNCLLAWRVDDASSSAEDVASVWIDRLPWFGSEESEGEWRRDVGAAEGRLWSRDDEAFAEALRGVQAIVDGDKTTSFDLVVLAHDGAELFRSRIELVSEREEALLEQAVPASRRSVEDPIALARCSLELNKHGLEWEVVPLCEQSVMNDPALERLIEVAANVRLESGLEDLALPIVAGGGRDSLRRLYEGQASLWED